MGRHEVGFVENTHKVPLDHGGCLFNSKFYVNKVPGNFHISTHSAGSQPTSPDMRHEIHSVVFGEDMQVDLNNLFFNWAQNLSLLFAFMS